MCVFEIYSMTFENRSEERRVGKECDTITTNVFECHAANFKNTHFGMNNKFI